MTVLIILNNSFRNILVFQLLTIRVKNVDLRQKNVQFRYNQFLHLACHMKLSQRQLLLVITIDFVRFEKTANQ